jgi:2-polyprenyl-3-methyl-5-hydroxy-6-metoxy-1,4-benzoquinol methylase
MGEKDHFDNYLTTHFMKPRDTGAAYWSYENDYGPFLPTDKMAAIVDAGCGTGIFIEYLRSKGYANVAGVDISPEMVDHCRKEKISGVEQAGELAGYFSKMSAKLDLVSLNDIIEHLPKRETVPILKAIKVALKPGGTLLVRTGNSSTPGGIHLRYKDFTHETGYTESSLRQVLRLAGFDDIAIKGNRYRLTPSVRSVMRRILLALWFFILRIIYLAELGTDRPRIYSKLLVAVCKNR